MSVRQFSKMNKNEVDRLSQLAREQKTIRQNTNALIESVVDKMKDNLKISGVTLDIDDDDDIDIDIDSDINIFSNPSSTSTTDFVNFYSISNDKKPENIVNNDSINIDNNNTILSDEQVADIDIPKKPLETKKEENTIVTVDNTFEINDKTLNISTSSLNNSSKNSQSSITPSTSSTTTTPKPLPVWASHSPLDSLDYDRIVPKPAMSFSHDLDPFQKRAIMHLERGESVFVAAHTSAGKTAVAEYAIALADFRQKFDSVGIVTGDVSINPDASCLILTTEVLRNMLYRGVDTINNIEWVIFDEIHYISDPDRGVVWEEVIILLPTYVKLVLLSATVPNAIEFANWIGRTKHRHISVVTTQKRPVPLEHFLWMRNNLSLIFDGGNMLSSGFKEAEMQLLTKKQREMVKQKQATLSSFSRRRNGRYPGSNSNNKTNTPQRQTWYLLVNHLKKKELLPAVVFSFSRKVTSEAADAIPSIDFTTSTEKSQIHSFFNESMKLVPECDRNLPQLLRVRDLLKRGLGIHHAGLLPIVKEVVEILFQKGYIKILFATETFAMGVNMPARTVCFNGIRKFDGEVFRFLTSGEYTQMAGRAGRRGIDKLGTVTIICQRDEVPEPWIVKKMVEGITTPLHSKFRLTYNMIANSLKIEDFSTEHLIKRSFCEFFRQRDVPIRENLLLSHEQQLIEAEKSDRDCKHCGDLVNINYYCSDYSHLQKLKIDLANMVFSRRNSVTKYLVPGRLCKISLRDTLIQDCLGVILDNNLYQKHQIYAAVLAPQGSKIPKWANNNSLIHYDSIYYPIDSSCSSNNNKKKNKIKNINLDCIYLNQHDKSTMVVNMFFFPLNPRDITEFYKNKIKISGVFNGIDSNKLAFKEIHKEKYYIGSQLSLIIKSLKSIYEMNSNDSLNTQLLKRPIAADFHINDWDFVTTLNEINTIEKKNKDHQVAKCPEVQNHIIQYNIRAKQEQKLALLRSSLSDENIELMSEYEQRLKLMIELGYVSEERTLKLKGRVACEINTCESIILTELIFENCFTPLSPEESVALLSALIFESSNKSLEEEFSPDNLSTPLLESKKLLVDLTLGLANLQLKFGISCVPDDFVKDRLHFAMIEVVYDWACGVPFAKICEKTTIEEGVIVRTIKRLDELCVELQQISVVLEDQTFAEKFKQASEKIRRDIVFAASLYLS